MAILFAFLSAISYGVAGLFLPQASQKEGTIRTMFYTQMVGCLTIIPLLFSSPIPWSNLLSWSGLWSCAIGLELTLANLVFTKAYHAGPLVIVSPITSSFAVITVALSILSGEQPAPNQIIGMLITIAGIVFATISSRSPGESAPLNKSKIPTGILYAILSAVLIGIGYWAQRFVVPVLGSSLTVLTARVSGWIGLFLLVSWAKIPPFKLNKKPSLYWLIPIGVLNTLGLFSYNLGISIGLTSVVSVISSLYSLVTIILGLIFLKARVTLIQAVGILITISGIVLINI